jgi:hypothetical protein
MSIHISLLSVGVICYLVYTAGSQNDYQCGTEGVYCYQQVLPPFLNNGCPVSMFLEKHGFLDTHLGTEGVLKNSNNGRTAFFTDH